MEEVVRAAIASIPSRSSPAEYAQHVVESSIARYESQGLDATLAHYNRAASVDGQWFAFIGDPDRKIMGHSNPSMIGRETSDIFGLVPFPPRISRLRANGWMRGGCGSS